MSLGTLGKLGVEVVANLAGFESDMGRANRLAKKESDAMRRSFAGAVQAVAAATTAAAALTAAAVKSAINRADELDELSQKVGVGVKELSRLTFAAQVEGVDDFGGALTKLSRSLVESQDANSQAAKAFKALGVSTTDASGQLLGTDVILTRVAESFSQARDSAAKAAIAQELFGKSGAELIPFLNNGASGLARYAEQSDRLGLTLSQETAAAAGQFNDQLAIGGRVLAGFAQRLAGELLPDLSRLSKVLVDTTVDSDALARGAEGISFAFRGVILSGVTVANVLQAVGKTAAFGAAEAVAVASGDFASAAAIAAAYADDVSGDLDDVRKAYASLFADGGAQAVDALNAQGDAAQGAALQYSTATQSIQVHKDAVQELIDSLKEEAATFGISRAQLEARRAAQLGATDAQKQEIAAIGEYLDIQKKQMAAMDEASRFARSVIERDAGVDSRGAADAIRRAGQQGGLGAFGTVQNGVANATDAESKRFETERARLQDSYTQRLIDGETFHAAVEAAEREHQARMQDIDTAGNEAKKSLYGNAFDAISQLGDDFTASVLAQSERGFEISKAISIVQATVKTYEAAIGAYNALVGIPVVGPGLAVAGAAAATTFGLAQVAAIEASTFPGRRTGGPVKAGGMYNFVEGGDPELLKIGNRTILAMGDRDGLVTPARVARDVVSGVGGGGGVKVYVTVNPDSRESSGADAGVDEFGDRIIKLTIGTMLKDAAEDGPYLRALRSRLGVRVLPRS